MSSLYSDGSIGVLLSNKIYFENFDLKLVKYIYKKKKKSLMSFWINKKLNNKELFAYSQYIGGILLGFIKALL